MAQQNGDGKLIEKLKYLKAQIQLKDKLIARQDKTIARQDKIIARRDKTIAGQDKTIARQDKIIARQDKSINKTVLKYEAEKKANEAKLEELKLSIKVFGTKIQEQEKIIAQLSMSELFQQKYKIIDIIAEKERCKIRKIQAINSNDDGSEYKAMKTMKISNENKVRSLHEKKVLKIWYKMKDLGLIEECEIYDEKTAIHCVQKLWHLDLEKYLEICGDDNMFKNNKNIALLMKAIVPKLNTMYQNKVGIVHCDIKAANLMMDYDKDSNEPIGFGLIDFELCYPNRRKWPSPVSFGSFHYRAPEMDKTLTRESFTITHAFDMYSLGITLLELIDGKHPYFDDLEEAHKSFKVYNELHGWIDQRRIDQIIESNTFLQMPQNALLKDLIANMIVADEDDRYRNIESVIDHEWYQKYCVESQCQILDELIDIFEFSRMESDKKEN